LPSSLTIKEKSVKEKFAKEKFVGFNNEILDIATERDQK
jgi:hypothetical protein